MCTLKQLYNYIKVNWLGKAMFMTGKFSEKLICLKRTSVEKGTILDFNVRCITLRSHIIQAHSNSI